MKKQKHFPEASPASFYFLDSRYISKGQTLIEALVAITVLIFAVLGIFALISRSVSLTRVVSDNYIATYLATEGAEIVKNNIDRNLNHCDEWNKNLAPGSYEASYDRAGLDGISGAPLHYDDASHVYSYSGGVVTPFYRTVTIVMHGTSDQEMQVNSVVSWKSRGGSQNSMNVEDRFFNWRSKPREL